MEEKKLVICPSEVEGVISFEDITVVHGEIRIDEIKAKHEEIEALKAQIKECEEKIVCLEKECEFADKIIEAKLAEDERIAAECHAEEPVAEEPAAEEEHFEQESIEGIL